MSNFDYMEYHCTKAIEDAEQDAIHNGRFHELMPLFPDLEMTDETLDVFGKYLSNFECVDDTDKEKLDELAMFVSSIVGKYLDLRGIAGFQMEVAKDPTNNRKWFEMMHGKFLMETPESNEDTTD